ncbi:MAG: helix-turn-helix domain-containing protein, partial [Candidatus Paceibacteria bacterium]
MALKPDVESWEFSDLEELRDEQWTESNTLEYKQDINIKQESDKKQLVKEVCGFTNANGGFLIYGVEELEGEPAYPVGIPGIHSDDADTRRVEDVIYSNITPRLHVRMKIIPIPKSENVVLLIYTPEGSAQPYYNWKEKRFHLRYEYKTQPMTEAEIAARYSERFVTEDRIKRYLHDTVIHHRNLVPNFREAEEAPDGQRQAIYGHILIYPSNISRRRVDTSDPNIFEFHDQDLRFPPYENDTGADYRPGPKRPGRFGVEWFRTPLHLNPTRLEVHRNGLIHRADDYGGLHQTQNEIGEPLLEPELYIRDNRICAN